MSEISERDVVRQTRTTKNEDGSLNIKPLRARTRLTLDVNIRDTTQYSVTVTQGDTNRIFEITLQDGGKPFHIPEKWSAMLEGIKPDGTALYNGCIVYRGKIYYDFASGVQIATAPGAFAVTIQVIDDTGTTLFSPKIWVYVSEDRMRELESESQFSAAVDIVTRLNAVEDEVDDIQEDIEHLGRLIEENRSNIEKNAEDIEENRNRIAENADAIQDNKSSIEKIAEEVDRLGELVSVVSVITIPANEWADDEPTQAMVRLPDIGNNMIALLAPANDETIEAASSAALTVSLTTLDTEKDTVAVVNGYVKPKVDLKFLCFVVKGVHSEDGKEVPPVVTFVGGTGSGSGAGGIYVGSDEPPETVNIWIDPSGEPTDTELWEFELDNGTTETKNVVVLD